MYVHTCVYNHNTHTHTHRHTHTHTDTQTDTHTHTNDIHTGLKRIVILGLEYSLSSQTNSLNTLLNIRSSRITVFW